MVRYHTGHPATQMRFIELSQITIDAAPGWSAGIPEARANRRATPTIAKPALVGDPGAGDPTARWPSTPAIQNRELSQIQPPIKTSVHQFSCIQFERPRGCKALGELTPSIRSRFGVLSSVSPE